MSPNQENEFFCDGITEEIINALAKINELKVTSRTSAFHFKGKNIPITQIGQQLGVSILLEGSVRLMGNDMRITAQLIDAAEDFHFWSETWDRKLDNVFQVQDEISLLIAERLREHFGHFEIQEHLVDIKTDSVEAYKFYLKGRELFNKWNPDNVKESMGFYEQALQIDPNHAEAMVGLADAYSFMASIGAISFEEGWGKCAELINAALAIDDRLPIAYYQLAHMAFFTECNFEKAYQQAQKALAINANHVDSLQFMAFLHALAGKHDLAKKYIQNALEIDPLSQETQFYSGYGAYMSEHYNKSIKTLDACLQVNPMNIPVHAVKALCLLKTGKYDEAINYWDQLPSEILVLGEKIGTETIGYALKGDTENALLHEKTLREIANSENGFQADSFCFMLSAAMKRRDKAFAWVEKAIKSKSPLLLLRYTDPLVNTIKGDPRYQAYHEQLYPESLFVVKKEANKKKALLDEESTQALKEQLQKLLDTAKPYLDPDLSLRSLAHELNLNANQLSWLLNEGFGKNFNEFINHYRVEEFKVLAKKPKNAKLTIMGIAYECGFNSKTVFNTYFKKETGLTPKQFLKG